MAHIPLRRGDVPAPQDRRGQAVAVQRPHRIGDGAHDVLDLRANVKRMWVAGKEVSLESRHTRLYEKYKNRPKAK